MEDFTKLDQTDEILPGFEQGKIRDETWSYIFENLMNEQDKLKEFTDKFDSIYYLSVHPQEIEIYKDNPVIYGILKRYEHTAEFRKLELMIFKMKEASEKQKQEALERLKKMYPWMDIKLDDTKYQYVVGYYWWTAWRSNSYYMDEIKKIYPVKTIN